jgi:hypothetical protein
MLRVTINSIMLYVFMMSVIMLNAVMLQVKLLSFSHGSPETALAGGSGL